MPLKSNGVPWVAMLIPSKRQQPLNKKKKALREIDYKRLFTPAADLKGKELEEWIQCKSKKAFLSYRHALFICGSTTSHLYKCSICKKWHRKDKN